MNTAAIRQQLHEYIEQATEQKVKGLYMLVEDEINDLNDGYLIRSATGDT